jgi:hypothetical protein
MKAQRGEQTYRFALSLTLEIYGGEWLKQHSDRFIPRKDTVPITQETGWAPGPDAENRTTTGIRSPDRPACSESLRYSGQQKITYCLLNCLLNI